MIEKWGYRKLTVGGVKAATHFPVTPSFAHNATSTALCQVQQHDSRYTSEMADRKLQELWDELDMELGRLRTAFDGSALGASALGDFDEYLSANEFGLALETLCDFLLDSDVPTVTPSLLLEIQRLHAKMGVNDNCVRNLRQKGGAEAG